MSLGVNGDSLSLYLDYIAREDAAYVTGACGAYNYIDRSRPINLNSHVKEGRLRPSKPDPFHPKREQLPRDLLPRRDAQGGRGGGDGRVGQG